MEIGTKAPQFSLENQSGEVVSLDQLTERYVVLFFYPKDSTPGCTIEARQFSQRFARFQELGAAVFGVSGGDTKSKQRFVSRCGLEVPLLSDTDFTVSKQFGVYGQKKFMGRTFQGISRKTVVLGPERTVIQFYSSVSPLGHASEVLEFLEQRQAAG